MEPRVYHHRRPRTARYKDILTHVKQAKGYTVKTCWVADVMEQSGIGMRRAPNRISQERRENPCPPDKREAIVEALKHFKMI